MKLKNLFKHFSCALLILIPSLVAMQPPQGGAQSAQQEAPTEPTLVALEIPNAKPADLARLLASFAQNVEKTVQTVFNQAGLKFIALRAGQIHLSLFDAPLAKNELHALATATQNAIRAMGGSNTFNPITLTNVIRLSNSIVVGLGGQGNNMIAQAAQAINQAMGNKSLPYSGHISIGRIKLLNQKPGQPTTHAEKLQIDHLITVNPHLIQAVQAVTLPATAPFNLKQIYLTHGGGASATKLAAMSVFAIKANAGTPKSLVKEVDRKK